MKGKPKDSKSVQLLRNIVLAGYPTAGFLTNPNARGKPSYIEVGEEKIVCLAQGGECRYNSNFCTPTMDQLHDWTTPVIDETCPNECIFKMLVCDGHATKCPSRREYNLAFNKYRGQFTRYCREFSRIEDQPTTRRDRTSKSKRHGYF